MLELLYNIIIAPLYTFLEIVFYLVTQNIGETIFIISVIVNILCLPLYLNAEKLQKEEQEIQDKLAPRVDSIKKNFKGDERHMLLQTYYKQNNYHPIFAFRKSLSLLLQIPFFTAAYLFFHNLSALNGASAFGISDLSKPDGLFIISGITINLLPILMTIINIISGMIYTKKCSIKENSTIIIMSLVFLILLYNSPSGLVLYWTFNNLFSLGKNTALRFLSSRYIKICSFILINFLIYNTFYTKFVYPWKFGFFLLISSFIIIKIIQKIKPDINTDKTFILTGSALCLLLGVVIPSNLIATSPDDFSFINDLNTPFPFLWSTLAQAFGLIVFWGGVLYTFGNKKFKYIMTNMLLVWFFVSLICLFLIHPEIKTLGETLAVEIGNINPPFKNKYDFFFYIISIFVSIITPLILIKFKKTKLINNIISIFIISFLIITGINFAKISKGFNEYAKHVKNTSIFASKPFNFTKSGKNILIIFVDRAISSYLPLIFEENPELKNIYSGFVYYPNTISYYPYTLFSYSALMGGYEYTPINMAKRQDKTLPKKHNEAILLLPTLFKNNKWDVTVTDASLGNYNSITNPNLFRNYGITYYNLNGRLGQKFLIENNLNNNNLEILLKRNLLFYSLMMTSTKKMRTFVYNGGEYLNSSTFSWFSRRLLESYAELHYLKDMTKYSAINDSLIIINNKLPHFPHYLSHPDYKLANNVEDIDIMPDCNHFSNQQYHVNAATLILLGNYLKTLKDNNVYDNTKIIIVSDHGYMHEGSKNPKFNDFQNNLVIGYNPLLLVKDFNSNKNFSQNNKFMTNADVPQIVTQGIIKNPINPFTGKKISSQKNDGVYIMGPVGTSAEPFRNKTSALTDDSILYYVNQNIFDEKNWIIDIHYSDISTLKKSVPQ